MMKALSSLTILLFLALTSASDIATLSGSGSRFLAPSAPLPVSPAPKAMTWNTLEILAYPASTPPWSLLAGSDSITNPYTGDTYTYVSLPVLCINKAGLPEPSNIPAPYLTSGGAERGTWSGGYVAITQPIAGTSLTSRTVANQYCAGAFGAGYRMAEFHDGVSTMSGVSAGWDFWGQLVTSPGAATCAYLGRLWVAISDQTSNPWGAY
jgi:hypothetical protein